MYVRSASRPCSSSPPARARRGVQREPIECDAQRALEHHRAMRDRQPTATVVIVGDEATLSAPLAAGGWGAPELRDPDGGAIKR